MPDLTKPGRLFEAQVEFTTNCNLRCIYCAVSQPWYQGKAPEGGRTEDRRKDLVVNVDELIEIFKRRQTKIVNIHGHGETTMLDGWHHTAQKFIDAGFDVIVCTNLIKRYSEEELRVLSKLNSITVSIDAVDQSTFKQLRGGDVRQLVYNMVRIRAIAEERSFYQRWVWSIVVVDRSLPGLLDVVKTGLALGVESFCFCDFYKEAIVSPVVGIGDMGEDARAEADRIMREVQDYCLTNGAVFMTSLDGQERFSKRGYL